MNAPSSLKPGDAVVNQAGWNTSLQNGATVATIAVDVAGVRMRIERDGLTVIEKIVLGVVVDGIDLGIGSSVAKVSSRTVRELWHARSGKARGEHTVDHREMTVELHHDASGTDWVVRVRASANGVAVRYAIPDLQGVAIFTADRTAFDLASFDRAWVLDYQTWYETPRVGVDLHNLAPGDYGFPFLIRAADKYVMITESGIDGRFSGAHAKIVNGTIGFAIADPQVEIARGDVTPWRVFIIGSLSDIVESVFVDELAPAAPPELANAAWVRPGRAAWSWWSDFYSGAQLEHQKRFVDSAAELSWEHLLIDCGWEETWVPEIVAYASERGIQVHLWTVWHDLDGPEKLRKLALWRSWGVAGIKVDFMESESKDRYRWYDSVLQETARLGMMVNFHGSVIPRGWSRTWPQVIGYEAIRGSEYYVFYQDTPLTAAHNVIQPFTRNVVGAMDYTPVALSAPGRTTTDGHELALSVAFESGITHFADDVAVYRDRPLVARFLSELASAWDETVLLAGTPDTEAVIARRSGDRWFIGCISTGPARTMTVPLRRLGLLDPTAWIVVDGETVLVESTISAASDLTVAVAENGGFVAIVAEAGLFRAEPRTPIAGPTVSPAVVEVDANREAVLTVTAGARLRVPPGWKTTRESDETWRVSAPPGLAAGSLGIVTVEIGEGVPRLAHARVVVPLTAGTHTVSSLPMIAFRNESGPPERDQSNGGGNPKDGNPMRIAGTDFADGLGVSTPSSVDLHLGGRAHRLTVCVGVDDETPSAAALAIVRSGDNVLASGVVTGGEPALEFDVDVTAVDTITLSTREVAEGDAPAHVDWASARIVVNPTTNVTSQAGHR